MGKPHLRARGARDVQKEAAEQELGESLRLSSDDDARRREIQRSRTGKKGTMCSR